MKGTSAAAEKRLSYLHEERGLHIGTLQAALLGWDGSRYTIPVRAVDGSVVNVRRYDPSAEAKMLNLDGYGATARWFGVDQLATHDGIVVVTEGEFDRLLAQQHFADLDVNVAVISGTHGAGTIPADLNVLRGRDVAICYDCDDTGRSGAADLAQALAGVAAQVRVVDLGLGHKEDITDFFVKYGRTAEDFADVVAHAPLATNAPAVAAHDGLFRRWSATELAAEPPPFRWLVKSLLTEHTHGVLAGEKKTLKTYTVLAIAVAVAAGIPAFGTLDVKEARPVHIYVGEGGEIPFKRRLKRIAEAYGVHVEDLPITASFETAPILEDRFQDTLRRDLDDLQQGLVILDPLYAFHGSQVSASNLYERGELLRGISGPVSEAGASLLIVDHFNKTGGGSGLDRISQSGVAEWADSWLLVSHRSDPDVDGGEFRLQMEVGSRQWGGRNYAYDLALGRFDDEAGDHAGNITWALTPNDRVSADRTENRKAHVIAAILEIVEEHPGEFSKTQVVEKVGGRKESTRDAFDELVGQKRLIEETTHRQEGGRSMPRKGWRRATGAESKHTVASSKRAEHSPEAAE